MGVCVRERNKEGETDKERGTVARADRQCNVKRVFVSLIYR